MFPETFSCIQSAVSSINREIGTLKSHIGGTGTKVFFDLITRKSQVECMMEIDEYSDKWLSTGQEDSYTYAIPVMTGLIDKLLRDKVYSFSVDLVSEENNDKLLLMAKIKACLLCQAFVETVLKDALESDIKNKIERDCEVSKDLS